MLPDTSTNARDDTTWRVGSEVGPPRSEVRLQIFEDGLEVVIRDRDIMGRCSCHSSVVIYRGGLPPLGSDILLFVPTLESGERT